MTVEGIGRVSTWAINKSRYPGFDRDNLEGIRFFFRSLPEFNYVSNQLRMVSCKMSNFDTERWIKHLGEERRFNGKSR